MAPNTFSYRIMLLNMALFYPALILGGYLLWGKSMPLFILYAAGLAATLMIGRYVVCRPCPYYGKPCPSFGFSYLAKIFPKARDRSFNGTAAAAETRIITLFLLMPIVPMALSWFGLAEAYMVYEYILMFVYVSLVFATDVVHKETGCNKCPVEACPMAMYKDAPEAEEDQS